jgi:hypothetical protein
MWVSRPKKPQDKLSIFKRQLETTSIELLNEIVKIDKENVKDYFQDGITFEEFLEAVRSELKKREDNDRK